jgi:hypothetical protein
MMYGDRSHEFILPGPGVPRRIGVT